LNPKRTGQLSNFIFSKFIGIYQAVKAFPDQGIWDGIVAATTKGILPNGMEHFNKYACMHEDEPESAQGYEIENVDRNNAAQVPAIVVPVAPLKKKIGDFGSPSQSAAPETAVIADLQLRNRYLGVFHVWKQQPNEDEYQRYKRFVEIIGRKADTYAELQTFSAIETTLNFAATAQIFTAWNEFIRLFGVNPNADQMNLFVRYPQTHQGNYPMTVEDYNQWVPIYNAQLAAAQQQAGGLDAVVKKDLTTARDW
jgi:hypothetical protein